jgi:hypothetical protein
LGKQVLIHRLFRLVEIVKLTLLRKEHVGEILDILRA